MRLTKQTTSALVVITVLLIDQLLKIWIKTHFAIGDEMRVFGNWFILHFTENPGMAFGMNFWGVWGKHLKYFQVGSYCSYWLVPEPCHQTGSQNRLGGWHIVGNGWCHREHDRQRFLRPTVRFGNRLQPRYERMGFLLRRIQAKF